MSTYAYGSRLDDDSFAITYIDEESQEAITKGEINGVEFESGGGGGSSDFSTAQVTIINNTAGDIFNVFIPSICEENELGEGSPALLYNKLSMDIPQGESIYEVPMYKGFTLCVNLLFTDDATVTTSGNIVYEDGEASITGDCTITIND